MHWCGLFKRIILYTLLFAVLYICSNITMHIFTFWGLTYRNPSNTTFNIALFSFLVLLVINYLIKKKFDKKWQYIFRGIGIDISKDIFRKILWRIKVYYRKTHFSNCYSININGIVTAMLYVDWWNWGFLVLAPAVLSIYVALLRRI